MIDPDDLLAIARETVAKVRYCFAITLGVQAEANARIVEPSPPLDDWCISFVTSLSSRKADEIGRSGRLTLAYQHDPDGTYVALVGAARLDRESAAKRALWSEGLQEWFPAGPDDPDVVVVRFRTERVELWNDARGILPEPKGLRAAVVARTENGWRTLAA